MYFYDKSKNFSRINSIMFIKLFRKRESCLHGYAKTMKGGIMKKILLKQEELCDSLVSA